MMKKNAAANNWQYAMLALVSACLIGAVFMMSEGSVLGENHTGIATVTGITGTSLIAGSKDRGAS